MDLMFEIAKYGVDPNGKKVKYLNSAISDWKNHHSNSNSQDTSVQASTSNVQESTKGKYQVNSLQAKC